MAFASLLASCGRQTHPTNPSQNPGDSACPSYTHKDDAATGSPASLPDGFFVFDRDTIPGLYKSRIHDYQATLVPNTEHDYPRSISISDDGKWVLYANGFSHVFYLIRSNGCGKTIVPVTNAAPYCLTTVGFYRDSPYGSEIFYLASQKQIHAVGVDLSSDPPVFKSDRVLADVGDSLILNPDPTLQIAVVKDQVFGAISPLVNGEMMSRTGYLTIPDGGRGIGGPVNMFKWKDDDYQSIDGCGHTMSFSGEYALANEAFISGIVSAFLFHTRGSTLLLSGGTPIRRLISILKICLNPGRASTGALCNIEAATKTSGAGTSGTAVILSRAA